MESPGHRPAVCIICQCEAHRFLSVGDLTIYLCGSHLDVCAECLALVDESIADEGNICTSCQSLNADSYAELAAYECHPGCPTCELLGP